VNVWSRCVGLLEDFHIPDLLAVGGSGDDRVYGGPGHDTLYAGVGADMLFAGYGNDVVIARAADGVRDFLFCGPGWDIAIARAEDYIDRSCERKLVVNAAEAEPDDTEATPPAEPRLRGNPNKGGSDPRDDNDPGQVS